MLIIWGKKLNRVRRGVVGHFCPVCRDVRVFSCVSVWRVAHVYYISLGGGEHMVDEFTCADCGVLLGMQAGAAKKARAALDGDVVDFAADTGPLGMEGLTERLEIEERLRAGALTPDERKGVIAEAIADLEYMAQQRAERGAQESINVVLALFLVIGLIASALLWEHYVSLRRPATWSLIAWLALVNVATALLAVVVVWRTLARQRLSGKRYVVAPLVRSLAPLRPSARREELDEVVGVMKKAGSVAAKGVRVEEVMAGIEAAR